MNIGGECALSVHGQIKLVHKSALEPTLEMKQSLREAFKIVTSTVAAVIDIAGQLKEGAGYFDPSDPRARAEQDLLAAASSIEAAAKKLSELKPRRKVVSRKILLCYVERDGVHSFIFV